MNVEEIKKAMTEELAAFKESLPAFVKQEDINKEIDTLKKAIDDQNIKGLEAQLSDLQKAAEEQGLALKKMEAAGTATQKSFRDLLAEKTESLKQLQGDQNMKISIGTTRKDVVAGSVGSDTFAFRETGVAQAERGKPWIRDLFNVVPLGANSHGSVKWYEQNVITNNAATVTEGPGATSYGTASNLTWVEKSLGDKRLKDFIKVSKDQLQDVDFIAGEVRELVERNMRLLENTQLYKGNGLGNNIKGITGYAQAFDTTGITVDDANMVDLIAKMRTQMREESLDGYLPNTLVATPSDLDLMRLLKDTQGNYQFPQWALGGMPAIGGLNITENSLVDANSLLLGDFSYGTVYEWNGLLIEIGYIDKDFLEGMITIMAYERINLRVKTVHEKAFMKVDDIAAAIAAITPAEA